MLMNQKFCPDLIVLGLITQAKKNQKTKNKKQQRREKNLQSYSAYLSIPFR